MRQRMRMWGCAVVAWALVAIPARATAAGVTIYLGLPSGRTVAYTTSTPGSGWTRAGAADVPAVYYDAFPALADLDGDGIADALVGDRNGMVSAFRNAGTDAAPHWQRAAAWDPPFDFGSGAAPALGDIDRDGDGDLLVGRPDGDVVALENTGGRNAPAWRQRPAWDVGDLGDDSRPALGDLDGDGRLDLLVGTRAGGVLAFSGPPFERRPEWDPPAGDRVAPALADVTGDKLADLFIGDGQAQLSAFRNAGGTWSAESSWSPPDPGSGPAGVAILRRGNVAPPPPPPGPGDGTPVARLAAAPTRGAPPLRVRLDASASSDPDGKPLTFAWEFGDGEVTGPPPPNSDPGAAITAAKAAYVKAKSVRDAGHYSRAVALYLDDVQPLLALTMFPIPGPVTARNTNQIDRVAHYYLGLVGHDLGGLYMFHDLGLAPCDRYTTALQYLRESAAQMTAGGWPGLPAINGTDGKIATTLDKLRQRGCAVPPYQPPFSPIASLIAGGPAMDHEYAAPGSYVARVTVNDGTASASASVTITVGDGVPPGGDGDAGGFGATTSGGSGGREIHVTEPTDAAVRAAFKSANAGQAIIVFDVAGPIHVTSPLPLLSGSNVTIEGNGATLDGSGISRTAAMIDVRGHDVIVRNIRLRNAGDNLRAQSAGAYNILVSHVSSTGAGDDGISIGYGAHDVTVQYCFLAGNTRSIFVKYNNTTNVSIHHSWLMKEWIRGPLAATNGLVDVRNVIIEDWANGATRFEGGASGNVVNSLYVLSPFARSLGGTRNALTLLQPGQVFTAGNVFRDQAVAGSNGTADAPVAAAPVTTQSVAEMEPVVRGSAGCLPRDTVDQAYIDKRDGWYVSKYQPLRLE